MASTNKTTNYELSQYIGSDKPTYLGDYNSDMLKIDTGMKANQTASTNNSSSITTINTNIGTMSSLETTATNLVGAINEVKSSSDTNTSNITATDNKIGDLANLQTDVKTSVVNAINDLVAKFNLTNIDDISNSDITVTNGTISGTSSLKIAYNNEGSIAKIYGVLDVQAQTTKSPVITFNSPLRPESELNINGSVIILNKSTTTIPNSGSITIRTNGQISFTMWNATSVTTPAFRAVLTPCLLFITDFGDIPVTP